MGLLCYKLLLLLIILFRTTNSRLANVQNFLEPYKQEANEEHPDAGNGEVHCKSAKIRNQLEINLAGKLLRRQSSVSRSVTSVRPEMMSRRQPREEVSLPLPQRPIPAVSYKLPTSLPCKVTPDKVQSAKLNQQDTDTLPCSPTTGHHSHSYMRAKKLPVKGKKSVKVTGNPENTECSNTQSTETVAYYTCTKNKDSDDKSITQKSTAVKTSSDVKRKRQLEQLVRILGQNALTPYLEKLRTVEKGTRKQAMSRVAAIDYNIIFGSQIQP